MKDQVDLDRLRAKRASRLKGREHAHLRATHGQDLVVHIANATSRPLSLDDFDTSQQAPLPFEWSRNQKDSNGLVAAYISKSDAIDLLACIRNILKRLGGKIGVDDAPYLGFATLREVDPADLLTAAESAESSILFYNDDPVGVLMLPTPLIHRRATHRRTRSIHDPSANFSR